VRGGKKCLSRERYRRKINLLSLSKWLSGGRRDGG